VILLPTARDTIVVINHRYNIIHLPMYHRQCQPTKHRSHNVILHRTAKDTIAAPVIRLQAAMETTVVINHPEKIVTKCVNTSVVPAITTLVARVAKVEKEAKEARVDTMEEALVVDITVAASVLLDSATMPLWVTTIIAVNYNLDTTVARAEKVARVAKEDIMAVVVVLVSATKSVKPSVNRPAISTGRVVG